jgi:hypothetical protein
MKKPPAEQLKLFVPLVHAKYGVTALPPLLLYAGRLVDMFADGRCDACLALGPKGEIGGGILWQSVGPKTVSCFGPYTLGAEPHPAMSEALLNECLGSIAKTDAVALINRFPTEDLPAQHFESLGTLTLEGNGEQPYTVTAYFRQMHEDPGTFSWCHPDVELFLRQKYRHLAMPRDILLVDDQGESKNASSVLSAECDRAQSLVTIRPVRTGTDTVKNIADHLQLFKNESMRNIFFEMDLHHAWQTDFTPGLLQTGFTPQFVLPYGGDGDILFFQWSPEA